MASHTQSPSQAADPNSTGGTTRQNTSAALQGTSNTVSLAYNCIYEGVVASVNIAAGLVSVKVGGTLIENCRIMNAAIGAYIGVQDVGFPLVGSSVLVARCPSCSYVIGGELLIGTSNKHWAPPVTGDVNYDTLDVGTALVERTKALFQPQANGLKMPIDMFPGEWEKSTGIGPALRLLNNLAQMDSGSLAKIEVHLMNDMVRILDNYFAHHHVGGDELIWNAKYSTWESHFTQYPHEAEGKLEENEELASPIEKAYDPEKQCEPDTYSATGRWRKSTYIGFLGDMIHEWITHPTEVASTYMKDADRATNYRQWVGSDGTYMLQASGGIQLEVNHNIICPTVLKTWNDINLKLHEKMENLNTSFLKIWGNGPTWEDLQVSCWQMRSYLRYIPLWHSLARWKQLAEAGYCTIPTQEDAPEANPSAGEEDRKNITGEDPYEGYAAINLSPAGTITITNGSNCSIIIDKDNIQIAAAGNLELKAGGTLSLSGRDVVIQAADNMEISSFFGGIIAKARTTFKTLVEKGRIWFKADMDPEDDDTPTYPLADRDAPEVEKKKYGIIFDATRSGILNAGANGFVAATTGEEAHISLETSGKDSDINIISSRDVNIFTSKLLKIKAYAVGIKAGVMRFATYILKIGERFLLKGGQLRATTVNANMVSAATHISRSKHVSQVEELPPVEFDDEQADSVDEEFTSFSRQAIESMYKKEELQDLRFEMPEWEINTDDVLDYNSYKASVWDDTSKNAKEDSLGLFSSESVEVKLSDTCLLPGTRTSTTNYPWPGKKAMMFVYNGGPTELLAMPMERHFTEADITTRDSLAPTSFTRYYIRQFN